MLDLPQRHDRIAHARDVSTRDGCFVVHDENSFNGVWVNNQIVQVKALKSVISFRSAAFCLMFEEGAA